MSLENSNLPMDANANAIQALRPETTKVVDFSASGAETTSYTQQTTVVRLACNQDCFVVFSTTAAASVTTSDMYMPQGSVEYFAIKKNQKVGAIQSTVAGKLFVTTMV